MAYCGPRGIPRSTFLAWPDEDQDAALAWAEMDRTVCSRCGTEPSDFDPAHGGHPFAFVAERRIDPGCELLDQEQENLREEMREDPRAGFGVQVMLVRNDDPDAVYEDA